MRKGLFKKYIHRRYNDGNVKGTINIARHIKQNTPFIGNVAYSQREFSYDNSLMELVRHNIEFIKKALREPTPHQSEGQGQTHNRRNSGI